MGNWDNLSLSEKAAMIRVAVKNGITNLQDIKREYNEFAEGGNIYKKGGNKNDYSKAAFLQSLDQSLKEDNRFSSNEFRRFFTELADMESGYRPAVTNSIGAKGYFQLMHSNRSASWSNPTQQFHEMYKLVGNNLNYLNEHLTKKDWERASQLGIDTYGLLAGAHLGGVGNVVKALRGKGNAKDMNGSSVIGYMTKFSQNGPSKPIAVGDVSIPIVQDIPEFIPLNSQAFNTTLPTYQRPELTLEEHVVQEPITISPYSPEELERQEKMDRLSAFNKILSLTNPYPQEDNSFLNAIGLLTGNTFSKGGKIHIKPENRGKFTALKKRTGHSATWFKEHGTPAQKKMAIFALNSRHWKHGLGGNLYEFGGDDGNENITPWKALDNIDYKAIPDTTFTKDKTGTGSIEYFNSLYPEGITYPNGYHREHPLPGKDVILYNPNDNDKQDIRLDALHIMPKDATYDVLNTLYREAAKDGDVAYNAKRRYEEDLNKYGKENIDSYTQYFNNEADGLLRNMLIEGTPEYIESKRYYPNKRELREWNRHLLPYIDNIQKYLETGERPTNILPEVAVYGKRKKKALGGNLFDGTTEDSQQMIKPNIFQRPDGSYFYSANDTEIDVTPMNTLGDNPTQWTYTDSSGKIYRPAQSLSPNYTLTESENTNPLVSAANNYFRELNWRAKNDPASITLQGKYTMPLVLSPILGKEAAVALANPYVDAALTSGFGAHGLQKLANGEADWTTALEIAPLGRLAKPLYKEATTAIENYRYPLGRLTFPENYTNITPKIRTRVGDVEIDNPLLTYRQGDASMGADFLDTGIVSMKNGSYDNPMFAQGKLFYGSPSENLSLLDPSINSTSKTRSGRVFLLRKPKDQTAKSDLLVSDIDMAHANKDSHIVSPYTKILDEEGNAVGTKVNEDIRRVPFAESPATSENTTLYRWKPNYGYKKVDSPKSTYVMGKELVDDSGNLNVSVDDLLEQIKAEYPYTLNPEDLVNKGLDGTTDLSEHIQAVVESAQEYPLPKGISRKEFVTAALYHDLGKMFGSFGHGTNSTAVVSELNLPITKNIIEAVSHHMNPQEYFETASQLEKALHAADVGRGMKYKTLIEKYPYLKYNDIP